ncbi:MAG: hypothetical protein K6G69_02525 [Lachnospiraceae bacterium]|nr:hypothetical protein [Lachnospiraceae bacterium]
MNNTKLLDCTLRDGGYINNWNFGQNAIKGIAEMLCDTNVDILELGFIRDVEYDADKAVFSDLQQVKDIIDTRKKNENQKIAVMAEIAHPMPIEKICDANNSDVDIIRVIVWKSKRDENGIVRDALEESFEYCKAIVGKGYELCVQPNRTDQYNEQEFISMIKKFSQLSPKAIYVVDSWGTMYSGQVLKYMKLADEVMPKRISLGFHGHNNMMQAFSTAEKIVEERFDREIILDASICGMGRGAGNLNLELIARYMNVVHGSNYNMDAIYRIYDKYIKEYQQKYIWGCNIPYLITADINSNPNYAGALMDTLTAEELKDYLNRLSEEERVLYPLGMPNRRSEK